MVQSDYHDAEPDSGHVTECVATGPEWKQA